MAYMNEIYGYGPSLTPPPFQMVGIEEIVDPRHHEAHQNMDYGYYNQYPGNRYNGQVQTYQPPQIYYGGHDPRRYHNHNDRADYTRNQIPNTGPISVSIQLSISPRYIDLGRLRSAFERCELRGDVLTVTAYPSPRHGPNELLAIVQRLTGDAYAYIVGPR